MPGVNGSQIRPRLGNDGRQSLTRQSRDLLH